MSKNHQNTPQSFKRKLSSLESTSLIEKIKKQPEFWKALEAYNSLPADLRADALIALGMTGNDDDTLRILTKSHFVLPGVTRWECVNCGECCRYAKKIATFTYESCAFLNEDNMCAKHDSRYLVCKWFPFWIYQSDKFGPLLTVKPYCSGYGHGGLVDYEVTMRMLSGLSEELTKKDDGAVVIHELLHVPGSKEWVFPSRANVDKLLKSVSKSDDTSHVQTRPVEERKGQLYFAQHYTSGLLGRVDDPHLTVDENGIVDDVNAALCDLLGLKENLLIGRRLSSLFVNEEGAENDFITCLYRGKVIAVPHRIKLADSSSIPVLFNAMIYRDRTDGLIHGCLINLKETSDTIYNELAQSKNYVRGLIEASLDAFMVINIDGTIADVNQALVNTSGFPREKLIGKHFKSFFTSPENARKGVSDTLINGKVENFELDLKTVSEEIIPVSFNATLFYNHEGINQGIFAVARDIRDSRNHVKQLEDAKSYARGLIESSLDLMVTVNHEGQITDVNHAATELTGYGRDELVGSEFKNYFLEQKLAQETIATVFEKGKLRMRELTLITKALVTIPVSFNANAYFNSQEVVQGVFAVARDISERIKTIEKLKEAENYARGLLESSIDLMVAINCEGIITDVNEAAVRLTGYSREDLINTLFQNYFTEPNRAAEGINLTLNNGFVRDYTLELFTQKKERVPVSFNASVYTNQKKAVLGVFAIARDLRV